MHSKNILFLLLAVLVLSACEQKPERVEGVKIVDFYQPTDVEVIDILPSFTSMDSEGNNVEVNTIVVKFDDGSIYCFDNAIIEDGNFQRKIGNFIIGDRVTISFKHRYTQTFYFEGKNSTGNNVFYALSDLDGVEMA